MPTRYPNGLSTGGNTLKMGAGTVTGATLDVTTGLTTILGGGAFLNEAPGNTAGDVYQVAVTFSGGTLTIGIYDLATGAAATEDTSVSWIAWGT